MNDTYDIVIEYKVYAEDGTYLRNDAEIFTVYRGGTAFQMELKNRRKQVKKYSGSLVTEIWEPCFINVLEV